MAAQTTEHFLREGQFSAAAAFFAQCERPVSRVVDAFLPAATDGDVEAARANGLLAFLDRTLFDTGRLEHMDETPELANRILQVGTLPRAR